MSRIHATDAHLAEHREWLTVLVADMARRPDELDLLLALGQEDHEGHDELLKTIGVQALRSLTKLHANGFALCFRNVEP